MQDALRTSIDATPAMLWSTDPDGRVDFLNQRWLDYAGLTHEAAKTHWLLTVHPDDRPGLFAYWREILATQRPGDYEARIRRSDGVYRWFIFRAAPYRDESGQVVKWYGQNVDIEDRRRAEDRLAGSNRLLEMVARGEPLAHVLETLCHVVEELEPGSLCGAVWSTPIVSHDGQVLGTFALHWKEPATPTPLHQKLIEQFTAIARIALERTRQENALRRSQAYLAEAERLSEMGSFSLNLKTGLRWWSEETYRIFGGDAARSPSFELMRARVHPDDRELLEHGLTCAARGEDFSLEFRLQMPDGGRKYLQVVAHALRSPAGDPFEVVGAVKDVTASRRSEEALNNVRLELAHVARVATLGELTASIAHEVNQPLAGIVNNASTLLRLLAEPTPPLDGVRAAATRTLRDANRAADIIARLRQLFQKPATSARVDLGRAARDVLALMRVELQQNQILVRTAFSPELPTIAGDRLQLQQVILNLIVNAIEAMSGVPEGQRMLEVRSEARDGNICLLVCDTGVGLSGADAERMFESFYSSKAGGMGMGLSISRSIVEAHRGKLWIAPNDGPGLTLHLSLPTNPP